jgi:UDP-2-acetamido-2,6-beta-L-arabino-hexul-4-ose reductase
MNITITGSDGFLGKNLKYSLRNYKNIRLFYINRKTTNKEFEKILIKSEIIFHFAGVNRSTNKNDFLEQNINFTKKICNILEKNKKRPKIIYTSTIQVNASNLYGISKKKSELLLKKFSQKNKSKLFIFRLPNIFGKWSKQNYNSVVSTFCFNVARGKKIIISKKNKIINLVYIDNVISKFLEIIKNKKKYNKKKIYYEISPVYKISLQNLANLIKDFKKNRSKYFINSQSSDLIKNLYSTYISFLPKKKIIYNLKLNTDPRGSFLEFLKTNENGQISVFTIKRNKIRGNHFHHSKVEKFLLLSGSVEFYMKDIASANSITIKLYETEPKVIESIPGWFHNIKNIGKKNAIILLWSNEVFNDRKPDTFYYE